MQSFEQKALDYYGEVVIRKDLLRNAGFGARSMPAYVGEWILSEFLEDGELTQTARTEVATFLGKYLPMKGQKDEIKNRLLNMETVRLLDDYSVSVNLGTGVRHLRIPLLDIEDGYISSAIVDNSPLMLTSGVWGIGEIFYIPPDDTGNKGQVWMRDFDPFQVATVDDAYFAEARRHFTVEEWLDLLVSSMGFNPQIHTLRQKMLLVTRIVPLVEPRVNLVELAPKGTGKSFVYDNLSRYARALGGGRVTAPVLFHNRQRNSPGLITRYDAVVLDEVQSVSDDSTGELVAGLKVYLESGRFARGNVQGSAEAGLVLLANIELDEERRPLHAESGLLSGFANFLRETAFVDRLHGLLPGWELPRVTRFTPSSCIGFKGDFLSEILHKLRSDMSASDYATRNIHLSGSDDLRDSKAITRLATGYLKLLFPNLQCSSEEFAEFCVAPAVELRQRIRVELHRMDLEYPAVSIGIEGWATKDPTVVSAPISHDPLTVESDVSADIDSPVDVVAQRIQASAAFCPTFSREIVSARSTCGSQPDLALVGVRRATEAVLRQIYVQLTGIDAERMTFFDMIQGLDNTGDLPEVIRTQLHTIRNLGNIGAHRSDAELSAEDVQMAVLAALRVAEWAAKEAG